MAKRRAGRHLLGFSLFGLDFDVRTVPGKHKVLDGAVGMAYLNDRVVYLSDDNTDEQARTTLVHEIQHMIEDHADADHMKATDSEEVADRITDQIARGWLNLIRMNPHLIDYLRDAVK